MSKYSCELPYEDIGTQEPAENNAPKIFIDHVDLNMYIPPYPKKSSA
jgi:hypothetical protein